MDPNVCMDKRGRMKYFIFIIIILLFIFNIQVLTRQDYIERAQARFELLKRRIQDNPFNLLEEGYLQITTKEGELVHLKLNPPQRRFLQILLKLLATGKPVYMVIDKARQWGGTTEAVAILYAITSQTANIQAMIIADDKDGASDILEKAKLMQEGLTNEYPHLATPTKRSSKREVAFEGLHSNILIETAENIAAGQKYTLQLLHASEVSKYLHAEEMFAGLFGAVAKVPGSIRILESTPNGVGGYFYDIVKEAEENMRKYKDGDFSDYDGEWILFFVPGWEPEEYKKPFKDEQEKQQFIATMDDDEKLYLGVPYETADGTRYVNLEQLNWRRWMIANEYKGNVDLFNQYYPPDVDTGFLVSGRPRFDTKKTKANYEFARQQEYKRGTLEFADSPNPKEIKFYEDPKGCWTVWKIPDPEEPKEYCMFIDPAGGEEIEGIAEGKKGDFNVIEIFERGEVLDQVAEYRSRIDPDLLADEAYKAHLAYSEPVVGVEINNHGRTTADHLKKRAPVYHREVMDEQTRKITKKLGWFTGPGKGQNSTKKLMIDTMASFIREDKTIIRSRILASECSTYVVASDGTTNAKEGCFDDTVIGTAGAIQMHMRLPMKAVYQQAVQVKTIHG